jgi:YcxB-like protein
MHLRFKYTFNDYAEASAARSLLAKVRPIAILIVLLQISLFIVMTLDQTNHSFKWIVSYVYPYLIVLVLISPWGMRLLNYVVWKSHRSLHKVITYEITDRSVVATTETSRFEMKWETFTQFIESKNLFVLYTRPYLFYMLPKRAFEGEAELGEFRELAQRRVSGGNNWSTRRI